MSNIFPWLTIGNLLILCATAMLGLLDSRFADRHVALSLFALLLSCLIQAILLTYFVVTGKMICQAVHLAQFSGSAMDESKSLKRSAVRGMAVLLASIVAASATGGYRWGSDGYEFSHIAAACAMIITHIAVPVRQQRLVKRNAALLASVLNAYNDRRGLGESKPQDQLVK